MGPTHMQRRALVNLTEAVRSLSISMNHSEDTNDWKRELANVESRIACLSLYIYKETPNEEEGRIQ